MGLGRSVLGGLGGRFVVGVRVPRQKVSWRIGVCLLDGGAIDKGPLIPTPKGKAGLRRNRRHRRRRQPLVQIGDLDDLWGGGPVDQQRGPRGRYDLK